MQKTIQLIIKSIGSLLILMAGIATVNAQAVDYRVEAVENPDPNGLYCFTIQIKGNEAPYIGSGSILMEYNANAILFAGSSIGGEGATVGSYTSINFDNDQETLNSQCEEDNGGPGFTPYAAHSFDGNIPGELLITFVLELPTTEFAQFACPSVANVWTDVAEICMQVNNPTLSPNLQFIGTENGPVTNEAGCNFNSDTDDPNDKYENGVFSNWTMSYNEFYGVASAPVNDECGNAIPLLLPTADETASNGPYTNIAATVADTDPVELFSDSPCTLEDELGELPFVNGTIWFTLQGDGNTYKINTSKNCGDFVITDEDYIDNGDTQMAVFTGGCGNYTFVACNEDDPNATTNDYFAGLSLETNAGQVYYIVIDGFNAPTGLSEGNFCINIINTDAIECVAEAAWVDLEASAVSDVPMLECEAPDSVIVPVVVFSEDSQYELSSTAGTVLTPVVNNSTVGAIGLNQSDINASGGTITITFTGVNTSACSASLELSVGDLNIADFCDPDGMAGCTDSDACNYNPMATVEDGSCVYGLTWYEDADEDGQGNPDVSIESCEQPDGYVGNSDDENDNCVGMVDECGVCEGPGTLAWYQDADNDGLGNPDVTVLACEQPDGYVANADDEDDACDGLVDECGVCNGPGIAEGTCDCAGTAPSTWYYDEDGNGFGDPMQDSLACEQPEGYVAEFEDVGFDDLSGIFENLSLSPIPAKDYVNIQFSLLEPIKGQMEVIGINGQLLYSQDIIGQVGENQLRLEVSSYAVGTYFVLLKTEEGMTAQKIVVE